ncbi:proto-oncogene Mas [Anolis carolinensis]|uniref:proto-oncogene Mas n=1 Tax=Anolis carolinensis TaxID=28377 RepID=UPI000462E3AE|nr:PREDICTED: proto-oncogene Mas [Anolis carolinensis]XP_008106529.1 PREDICTED: proto-oncogene Mas [Anolis carolinensis]XP_016848282.1 PREDICTED: proto-oncogene Mas [Anolis carolinensis]|eukprot:XP_008106528.1 PREDICTED: proto-oncogene Mas [Anolis carolinensis]
MTQLNITPWLQFTDSIEAFQGQNSTSEIFEDEIFEILKLILLFYIAASLISIICIFGLVGNAIVIWYLCFLIKKNPITTYVLNLAAADSGVLLSLGFICIKIFSISLDIHSWLLHCFFLTYTSSQYLLTAISVEKCLSVVFPIWYRCHRPKYLSALICTLLWIMSCLMLGELFSFVVENSDLVNQITSIVNFIVCTPVVIICTILLFIRTYCSVYQHQRGKFYAALLRILLIFIFFGTPLSIAFILLYFDSLNYVHSSYLFIISVICASINSSVNPLIYFLIGRKKMKRSRETFRLVLQSIFSDNIDCRVGGQPVSVEK